jgi:hypothetical protein
VSGPSRQRKPGGFHLRRRRRRRDEDYIWTYQFPEHVESRCRRDRPELTDREWKLVEQGLREWFLCCAWRDGEVLGMPSRLVDEAWHEFILDSLAYTEFCDRAFGEYLHHTPETSMTAPMSGALDATTRAWDRSSSAGGVLWSLDALLGLPQMVGGGDGGGHHHHSGGEGGASFEGSESSEVGGGDSGGSGDSGGGCGGGDSGGGGCGGGGGE